jgi:hypothetical protein
MCDWHKKCIFKIAERGLAIFYSAMIQDVSGIQNFIETQRHLYKALLGN